MTDEEVEAAALSDPDNPPATEEELDEGVLVSPFEKKVGVFIRLDPEIVEHYRSQGKGYQTRINDDLLELVRSRTKGAPRRRAGGGR